MPHTKIIIKSHNNVGIMHTWAGEPESDPERPESHDLAGAILFFLQKPKHLKNWNGAGADIN